MEASIDYSNYRLPKILADYTAQYPDVTLKVSSNHSRDCMRRLQEGQAYLAIVRGEYDWPDGKILLEREAVCLIRSRAHANTPLDQMRYIGRDSNPEHMSIKARWLMEHGLEPTSALNVDGLAACVSMVQAGLGWSIVPEICLSYFDGLSEPLFSPTAPPHPLDLPALPQAGVCAAAGAGVHPDHLRPQQCLNLRVSPVQKGFCAGDFCAFSADFHCTGSSGMLY